MKASLGWVGGLAIGVVAAAGCGDDATPSDGGDGATTAAGDSTGVPMGSGDTAAASTGPGSTGTAGEGTGTTAASTDGPDSSGDGGSTDATGSGSGSDSGSGSGSDSGSDSGSGSESTTQSLGDAVVGDDCTEDVQCMTGVCWDFADYDPFCFGAVCSVTCDTNEDCHEAFADAGAMFPMSTSCGADGRCDPIGSGFGAFACAAPG